LGTPFAPEARSRPQRDSVVAPRLRLGALDQIPLGTCPCRRREGGPGGLRSSLLACGSALWIKSRRGRRPAAGARAAPAGFGRRSSPAARRSGSNPVGDATRAGAQLTSR